MRVVKSLLLSLVVVSGALVAFNTFAGMQPTKTKAPAKKLAHGAKSTGHKAMRR